MISIPQLEKQLKKHFRHTTFRENQGAAIQSILNGQHTLVIMPTGRGKSLCYQLPAVIQPGIVIVISPLVALMKNQVDSLHAKGIPAAYLTSTLTKKELTHIQEQAKNEEIKLLYISPETLNKESTLEFVRQLNLSYLVIDEAHCISEWGHDFRPEYRKIQNAAKTLGHPAIMALTATATPKVEKSILNLLEMDNANVFRSSFSRDNLTYEVMAKEHPNQTILQIVANVKNYTGIIYCQTRKKVEEVTKVLEQHHYNAESYHAGIDSKTRNRRQEAFLSKEIDIMVATIAFGMGIDKADIQFVIHYDAPKSIESYYQETGRAGRNGKEANCFFLYSEQDILKLKKLSGTKTLSERKNIEHQLEEVAEYATCPICRRQQILYYFGEIQNAPCQKCDNCKKPTPTYEVTTELQLLCKAVQESQGKLETPGLLDLLAGYQASDYLTAHHHTLPSFGAGSQHTPNQWKTIIRQALLLGFLEKDRYYAPVVRLLEKGTKFIANPTPTYFHEEVILAPLHPHNHTKQKALDTQLLTKLKKLRQELADKNQIKPYFIFSEQVLTTMATDHPKKLSDLCSIPSVEPSKAEKFGDPFLSIIDDHLSDHPDEELDDHTTILQTQSFAISHNVTGSQMLRLIKQIDKKMDLEVMADIHQLSLPELITELEKIVAKGIPLRLGYYIDKILTEDEQESLLEYFEEEAEEDNIEQACDELEDEFNENEVRLMRLHYISQKKKAH